MAEEITSPPVLWVHQETLGIHAESHDIWAFTPEFLFSAAIVPDEWKCTRATRSQNVVEIQYGPITWVMNEGTLWITSFSDCPWGEEPQLDDGPLVPYLARSFLRMVPHLPSRRLAGFWRVSTAKTDSTRWMLDNFLPAGCGNVFDLPALYTRLSFVNDRVGVQMDIRAEAATRGSERFDDSIVFDCHVTMGGNDLPVDELALETFSWSEWRQTVEWGTQRLLQGGEA